MKIASLIIPLALLAATPAFSKPPTKTKTKTGLCVGDYSLTAVNGHFIATPPRKGCPAITIKKDRK